jgi:hypothetical protein
MIRADGRFSTYPKSRDCEMKKYLFSILLIISVITGCASSKLDDPIASSQEYTNNQIQLVGWVRTLNPPSNALAIRL